MQKWISDNDKSYIKTSDVKNRINIVSNEKELTRWLSSIGDISVLAKMNGNDAVTWGYENTKPNEIAIVDENLVETNKSKYISEAYHKAKADGSNPELVAAVEDLLGKQKESSPTPQTGKGEGTKPMGEGGEQGGSDVEEKRSEIKGYDKLKELEKKKNIVTGKQIGRAHV